MAHATFENIDDETPISAVGAPLRAGAVPYGYAASNIAPYRLHTELEPLAAWWTAFEREAICTPYQRHAFLSHWQSRIGAADGVTPLIVELCNPDGTTAAILPFGIYKRGPFCVAGWLGDKHMNYFMGLYHPDVAWDRIDMRATLQDVGRASKVDLFYLKNQPQDWGGFKNPISTLTLQPSPSAAYRTALSNDFDAFLESRPKGRWKRQLRNKRKKLATHGEVVVSRVVNCEQATRYLDTYFAQKARRLAAQGIRNPFEPHNVRSFFRDLVCEQDANDPVFELYALWCDDEILAVYAGSHHQGRFATSVCSVTDGPLATYSPGELLLQGLIEDRCARGDTILDLGIGEARYKTHWCPEADFLFDTALPVSRTGHMVAWATRTKQGLKRAIKQNSLLWSLYRTIRSRFGARNIHPAEE